ncbi:MAG: DsbA family protein [Thermomicrobiales bacterium]
MEALEEAAAGAPLPPRDEARSAARQQRRSARKIAEESAAKQQRRNVFVGVAVIALVVAGVLIFLSRPQTPGVNIVAAEPLPATIAMNGAMLGTADAPVQIVEWGDYQCPACGQLARGIAPRVISEYVVPGKASFEFRNFAFLGPESQRAAAAANCAEAQGAFWPYHDTLYVNQHGENQGAFTDERLKAIADSLSLDATAFAACLDDPAMAAAVTTSTDDGREAGVNATPWLTVNGVRVENWQDWATLSAAIDAAAKP